MAKDKFQDIRPYNDDEVPAVIDRLVREKELAMAIARLKFPRMAGLLWPLVRWRIKSQLRHVKTIHDFQMLVEAYLDGMLERCTDSFTVEGIDALDSNQAYLFMSNHRDIALDPALVNLSLHRSGADTVRIAIGDNLLTKDYVSDLMRINKSFLVKRSVKGVRALFVALKKLSAYIRLSLEEGQSVWIAQKEGRAKDGIDRSDPAIIKMFSMSHDADQQSFSEFITALKIVPVSIAYEYDPCDAHKARELHEVETTGAYEKGEQEDIASIARGIAGQKGRVHLVFGTPLQGEFADADAVAAAIDRHVVGTYHLFPSNLLAYEMLHGCIPEAFADIKISAANRQRFLDRVNDCDSEYRSYFLNQYANPVASKLELQQH